MEKDTGWDYHKVQCYNPTKVIGGVRNVLPLNTLVLRQTTLKCYQHCIGPFETHKIEKERHRFPPGTKREWIFIFYRLFYLHALWAILFQRNVTMFVGIATIVIAASHYRSEFIRCEHPCNILLM